MTFRFLHLADLHLETRFGGRPATRARLREATREALGRAVDLALERELHAVLIAGDAFDEELLSRRTELQLVDAVRRLAEAGVHVLYCAGNHDPGGGGHRAARLGLEPGVGAPWHERVHLFRSAKPEIVQVRDRDGEAVGVVVGAGHPKAREDRNLAAGFVPLERGLPVVGLLHTQVESASGAERHDRYAPCTREDLARVDYDYWALGHVHQRQRPFPDLPAWYAGNLQGRHANETGPKGGLLVTLEPGEPADPAFVPLAPVRWERLELADLEGCATLDALATRITERLALAAAAGPGALAARVELVGRTPLAGELRRAETLAELEEELLERSAAVEVQLDAGRARRPRDLETLRAAPCALSEALTLLESARGDPELLDALAPPQLAGLDPDADPVVRREYLIALAADLEEELLERGLEEEPA